MAAERPATTGLRRAPAPGALGHADPPGANGTVFDESLQVGRHLAGGGIAVVRIAGDGLEDDRLQVAGNLGAELPRFGRVGPGDLPDQGSGVRFVVGGAAGQHLVQRQPQPVDVAADVGVALELLGGHVSQRAADVAGAGHVGGGRGLGEAEVGDLHSPVSFDEQVGRLDVAMHGALAVGVVKRAGRLPSHVGSGRPEPSTPSGRPPAEEPPAQGLDGSGPGRPRVGGVLRPRRTDAR